jgi:hypothetical protein
VTTTRLFAWCATRADLPRACADLSEFLALQRRRIEVPHETMLGLWVDPSWRERIPCELFWREPDGRCETACIREAAGVEGIWMLCWLEVPAASGPVTHRALLASLAVGFEAAVADPPAAFVPVFPLDAPAEEVRIEWERLTSEHSDRVLAPLYQDARSGRLLTGVLPESARMSLGAPRRGGTESPRSH